MGKFHCIQCKSWIPPRKMFMVKDHLWEKYGVGKDYLCLDCFKIKIGRILVKNDFTDCWMNKVNGHLN